MNDGRQSWTPYQQKAYELNLFSFSVEQGDPNLHLIYTQDD